MMGRYEKVGIIFPNGSGINLSQIRWHKKTGNCDDRCIENREDCCMKGTEAKKCENNIVAHACKHVVCGTEYEKQAFDNAVKSRWSIPEIISSKTDNVVTQYENIGMAVANDADVIMAQADDKGLVFSSVGRDNCCKYVDYMRQEEDERENKRTGISSMFATDLDLNTAWVIDKTYEKYHKKSMLHDSSLRPVSEIHYSPVFDSKVYLRSYAGEIEMSMGSIFYRDVQETDDISPGVLRYHYSNQFEDNSRLFDFYREIEERCKNHCNETGENLKSFVTNLPDKLDGSDDTIKWFEKCVYTEVKDYQAVYRHKVMSFYLGLRFDEELDKELAYPKVDERMKKLDWNFKENMREISLVDFSCDYEKIELFILKKALDREENNFIQGFFAGNGKRQAAKEKRKERIEDRYNFAFNNDESVALSAFSFVNSLVYYTITLYITVMFYDKAVANPADSEMLRNKYSKWEEIYDEFEEMHSNLKDENLLMKHEIQWWEEFNQLIGLKSVISELSEMFGNM